jgi:hypothetical protein
LIVFGVASETSYDETGAEREGEDLKRPANRDRWGKTNAINSTKEKPFFFPAPSSLVDSSSHLLRSVTEGFSQSLAWLGWDAPSSPDAVGGSGREAIFFFFSVASASGSTPADDDGRAPAGGEKITLLASGFDGRRQKGVARDAMRRESAGGASEVGLGRKKKKTKKLSFFEDLG